MNHQPVDKNIPLVVDLDGTFINTDLLFEGIMLLIKKNPLYIFSAIYWVLKGKVTLKNEIFKRVELRYDLLPYNKSLISFLEEASFNGRQIILATASLKSAANEIARLYPFFNKVFGTENINLKAANKSKLLVDEFGEKQFDYIGNSTADLPIFKTARYAYLVNASSLLEKKTSNVAELKENWQSSKVHFKDYVKAIRAYQWIKNILIFVPLITSHSFYTINLLTQAIAGFFAFSFVASAGYVINDLLDLNADRSHPRKKNRAFASGKLSILFGAFLAVGLLFVGIAIASLQNFLFLFILIIYFVVSFSYSIFFKKIVLYDVFILALLYSTRVLAGGLVTGIAISFWLIAFSTFLFLSLAFVKRYSELMKNKDENGLKERGREYVSEDLNLLQMMGIVSGFISVVVFSLYIDSTEVKQLYAQPKILWAISLLFLFWISRIWVITNRGKMTDDPIVFTVKDSTSYCIFLIIGIIMWLAM